MSWNFKAKRRKWVINLDYRRLEVLVLSLGSTCSFVYSVSTSTSEVEFELARRIHGCYLVIVAIGCRTYSRYEVGTAAGNTTCARSLLTGAGLELVMSAVGKWEKLVDEFSNLGHPMFELMRGLSKAIIRLPTRERREKQINLIDVVGTLGYLKVEPSWTMGSSKRFGGLVVDVVVVDRSLGLAACASLESKNEVCLLCEVNPKQIPAFDFICASLESILAIEDTWERERSGFAEEKDQKGNTVVFI
ncbi:hypothetical protein Tco_0871114, partial [Tanacetum coccineum]